MKISSCSLFHRAAALIALLALAFFLPSISRGQTPVQNAQNLNISFNGPDAQFPYMDTFYAATIAYYQSIGRISMSGNRHCHAYLSWDIAQQAQGSGPIGTEGSRSWFEDWLSHAQGHCDEALITFKYVSGVTIAAGAPAASTLETAFTTFMSTSWAYTGWSGTFSYTPWNEPNNGTGTGDGLTVQIGPELAADYYLVMRKHCVPSSCTVAAGDFGSNGNMWKDFVQNCTNDLDPTLCSNASYMDKYKHYLAADTTTYGFSSSFRPEVFAYHGWDDVNNYINTSSQCTDQSTCTARALFNALAGNTWTSVVIWDTEVGAGQNPQSNPDPVLQACAASFLLRLTSGISSRFWRIYYTKADESDGQYWSLFDSTGTEKPAFSVLADRNISYTPPAGSTCP